MRTFKSKRILSAILAICLVFGSAAALPSSSLSEPSMISASAQGEQQQEQGSMIVENFDVREENGSVIIQRYVGNDAEVTIPAKLNGKKVTVIDDGAFAGNQNLKKVVISEGIKELRTGAFHRCTKLESVTLPESLLVIGGEAFSETGSLKSVKLPSKLERIEDFAFTGTGVESITIPNSVKYLGIRAFADCENLKKAVLGTGMKEIEDEVFCNCHNLSDVTIPKGYTRIGCRVFTDCNKLENINLPDGLVHIDEAAFGGTSLKKVTLPKTVEFLGSWSFAGTPLEEINLTNVKHFGREALHWTPFYDKLAKNATNGLIIINDVLYSSENFKGKTLTVPSNIKEIAGQGISHAVNLEKVIIPDNVKRIGDNCFDSDSKLKEVVISKNVESIGMNILYGCNSFTTFTVDKASKYFTVVDGILYTKDMKTLKCCPPSKKNFTNGGELVVPDGVVEIYPFAFSDCSGLKKLVLPKTLKLIGMNAITNTGISELTIPDGVEEIPEWAVGNNPNLAKVTLPNSLVTIGYSAFRDDPKLAEVTIPEGTYFIGDQAFANTALKSVLIPHSVNEIQSNAFGVSYKQNKQDEEPEMIVDKNFILYGYDRDCPARFYAEQFGVQYIQIGDNQRYAGATRFDTAVEISKTFEKAETVYIVNGMEFADALSGVSLAAKAQAPILMVGANGAITDSTLKEIKRLGAKNAVILGGESAVAKSAVTKIEKLGVKTTRVAGKNRFETAAKIAENLYNASNKQAPENIFFVVYNKFADALSVSPAAGASNSPVLYVTTDGDIDAATKAYLDKVKGKVKNVYILGGTSAVSTNKEKLINKYMGVNAKRLAGSDRFATNIAIIKEFANGPKTLNQDAVGLATGFNFPDALASSVVAAINRFPLILTNGKQLTDDQKKAIKDQKSPNADNFIVATFGGENAVPESIALDACMQVQFKNNNQGGNVFEDSLFYQLMQKMDKEPFEAEMDMFVSGVKFSSSLIRKNGNDIYTKSTSVMGDDETYTIGGKTYDLDSKTKTYTVGNADSANKSIIDNLINNNAKYDLLSTKEDNGNIVEEIRQTTKDGNEVKVSEFVCTFKKDTGALTRIESKGGETPLAVDIKSFKPGPVEIKLPDLKGWKEVKKEEAFQDSHMYQFLQKVKNEAFESEMVLTMPGYDGKPVNMKVIFKKNDKASYQYQESPMGLMESYRVGGKAYCLLTQAEIKRYNTKDNAKAKPSLVETFFTDNEKYELKSCGEDNGNIVEEIEATSGNDTYLLVCTFNKQTGILTRIETIGAGQDTSLDIKTFKTGPQDIKAPDLTGWEKDDTLDF